jgi:hypothetical protein
MENIYFKMSRSKIQKLFTSVIAVIAGIILAAFLGLAFPNVEARPQKGSGDPRVLSIIPASDPAFDASLDANFPGIRKSRGFDDMRPLLAIVQNTSLHSINALVIQWSISFSDGSRETAEHDAMSEPDQFGRNLLSGAAPVLRSGEIRLVSPSFSLDVPWYKQLVAHNVGTGYLLGYRIFSKLASKIHSAQEISVSVDGIVYDDGVFVGADNSKLFERYQYEQQGQREEGASMLRQLNADVADDQILQTLNQDIQKGAIATGSDDKSLFIAGKGREAQRLLGIFQNNGRTALRMAAVKLSGSKVAGLSRQTSP